MRCALIPEAVRASGPGGAGQPWALALGALTLKALDATLWAQEVVRAHGRTCKEVLRAVTSGKTRPPMFHILLRGMHVAYICCMQGQTLRAGALSVTPSASSEHVQLPRPIAGWSSKALPLWLWPGALGRTTASQGSEGGAGCGSSARAAPSERRLGAWPDS